MDQKLNQLHPSGWILMSTAAFMLSFWILFAILLPMQEEYINWILDKDWTWINLIGFVGSLLGIFALNSILSVIEGQKKSDLIAYFLAVSGIVILTSILFFEGFILKGLALENPEIIDFNSGFYQHIAFKIASNTGGILLSIGVLMLGISMLRKNTFKKWKVILFMIACPLFGIVSMPGNARLLGVLLYAISLIALGAEMNKKRNPSAQES